MSTEHPFPLEDDTVALLRGGKEHLRPVWELYHNPYFTDPQPDEWPHTVECFAEWYRRNAGLLTMAKPILEHTWGSHRHDSYETLVYTFVNSVERAFADLRGLIDWAIIAWEFDPLLCEVRNPSPGETKPDEREEDIDNVVKLPLQT